ncbi:MAG: hypothetical protein HY395_00110 [Candidatus Doudnabacteria bacterium]|nr:hypothetical protein [Candidatus Doudnabacteria bacterium]
MPEVFSPRRDLRGESHLPSGINEEKTPKRQRKPKSPMGQINQERSDRKRRVNIAENFKKAEVESQAQAAPNSTHDLTPEQVARILGVSSLDKLPRNEQVLLETGAKLAFDNEGGAVLYGYAHDGSDVDAILQNLDLGYSDLKAK